MLLENVLKPLMCLKDNCNSLVYYMILKCFVFELLFQDHPNLNFSLLDPNGNPIRMNMSEEDKLALKLFMETLTDGPMLTDEKFSDPF